MQLQPNPIFVTKAVLPPLDVYSSYLKKIWASHHLTNFGPLAVEFERCLQEYCQNLQTYYVSNGTIALQIAIRSLDLVGSEVITTPFSYVATTSSLVWEHATPIFVDIDEWHLGIDEKKIEAAVTPKTKAILATHVFGYPCAVEEIGKIAEKHGLKVIYDAAHAFGVTYKGRPLVSYGDISTLSFHATKLFHTVEGGAVLCSDKDVAEKVAYMRNFGHNGQEAFFGLGINGKNSEFHAAMGLSLWSGVSDMIAKRLEICRTYSQALEGCSSIIVPKPLADTQHNGAYFPIIFSSEQTLVKTRAHLEKFNVFTRRYFYPSLTSLPYIESQNTPVADSISRRILCLPVFPDLPLNIARDIAEEVISFSSL